MTRTDLKMFAAAALSGLCITAAGAISLSAAADGTTTVTMPQQAVKVYGCKAEDDCRVDYRADRDGRGVWIIHRDRNH